VWSGFRWYVKACKLRVQGTGFKAMPLEIWELYMLGFRSGDTQSRGGDHVLPSLLVTLARRCQMTLASNWYCFSPLVCCFIT